MKYTKIMLMACLTVGFLMLMPSLAVAGDATFEIDIQSSLSTIVSVVFAALGAIVTWVFHKLAQKLGDKTGIEIEDSMRAYIEVAILNGLKYGENLVLDKSKDLSNPEIESQIISTAVTYALEKVPDALKYFGLDDEDKIRELVIARLPELSRA